MDVFYVKIPITLGNTVHIVCFGYWYDELEAEGFIAQLQIWRNEFIVSTREEEICYSPATRKFFKKYSESIREYSNEFIKNFKGAPAPFVARLIQACDSAVIARMELQSPL